MVEGLMGKQEKPSNTEVLGELINNENLPYITNLTPRNINGLFRLSYFLKRIEEEKKKKDDSTKKHPVEILQETITECLAYKCSVSNKKSGTRADQIVDALKHIIEDENKDDLKSLAQQIKS